LLVGLRLTGRPLHRAAQPLALDVGLGPRDPGRLQVTPRRLHLACRLGLRPFALLLHQLRLHLPVFPLRQRQLGLLCLELVLQNGDALAVLRGEALRHLGGLLILNADSQPPAALGVGQLLALVVEAALRGHHALAHLLDGGARLDDGLAHHAGHVAQVGIRRRRVERGVDGSPQAFEH
jgi:hypothetical protein